MNIAIILAAGSSKRYGKQKLLEPFSGKPVLSWSLSAFEAHPKIHSIILVVSEKYFSEMSRIAREFPKVTQIVLGGETRFHSSQKGFESIPKKKKKDVILFHNAANPLVTSEEISMVISSAKKYRYSGVGRKIFSALRRILTDSSFIVPRKGMYEMETPQALQSEILEKGIKKWRAQKKKVFIDDLQFAELLGYMPQIVPAHPHNRKITVPEDLEFLSSLEASRPHRVGIGEDSHQFSKKKNLCRLAGITIPHAHGFEAKSDGDIALHALCNAISSALGGNSFSYVADKLCKNSIRDSEEYVAKFLKKLEKKHGNIENVTLVFEGKKPLLEKHFPRMRKKLSQILHIAESAIGLSAHTGEKLTPFGKGVGMRVLASVLIRL
ncbi:2-C-methyl-D-erythritol 2,4-cyclodiphosphate synthase [Candidatus Peregrinibacteria bacterium]|nr:2-C-methyl-D-erythritol 2,4-cyclodiphosphate synthase [Candidatus Peregrinibacteria bacterium]